MKYENMLYIQSTVFYFVCMHSISVWILITIEYLRFTLRSGAMASVLFIVVTYSLVSKVMMMRMGLLFMPPTQLLLHMKLYRMVVNSVPTWNTWKCHDASNRFPKSGSKQSFYLTARVIHRQRAVLAFPLMSFKTMGCIHLLGFNNKTWGMAAGSCLDMFSYLWVCFPWSEETTFLKNLHLVLLWNSLCFPVPSAQNVFDQWNDPYVNCLCVSY